MSDTGLPLAYRAPTKAPTLVPEITLAAIPRPMMDLLYLAGTELIKTTIFKPIIHYFVFVKEGGLQTTWSVSCNAYPAFYKHHVNQRSK